MEKVVRTVGTLLLVGVLVLSVLTYAGIFNITSTLDYIKTGVSKLVTWFVPEKFTVTVTPLLNGSTYSSGVLKVTTSVDANTDLAYVDVDLKGAPVEIVFEASKSLVVVDIVTARNATVIGNLPADILIGRGIKLEIYPMAGKEGSVRLVLRAATSITASVDDPLEIYIFHKKI
jgi:hypothetical protein